MTPVSADQESLLIIANSTFSSVVQSGKKKSRLRHIITSLNSHFGVINANYTKQISKILGFLSFIKDKIIIFAANFIYKRYEGNSKTKLS